MKVPKVLAFIGARKGSKGLPLKNIRSFLGKPLIAWSIEAALQSQFVTKLIVSTDCSEIARVAQSAGADVPFLRPVQLGTDDASIKEVILHALDFLEKKQGESFDYIILLQPTSPLRTVKHIDEAMQHYFDRKKTMTDTLVSVKKVSDKMAWLMHPNKDGYIHFCILNDLTEDIRRQAFNGYYLPNGSIFISPVSTFNKHGFYNEHTLFYEMDDHSSVDIDTLQEFEFAEQLALKRANSFKEEAL